MANRKAIWVSGGHRDEITRERSEDPREHRTAVISRRDESDLTDHSPQRRLGHACSRLVRDLRNDWEFLRIHPFDVCLVRARFQMNGLRSDVEGKLDVAGWK